MKLDSRKELTPVVFSNMPVKTVGFSVPAYKECFKEHWHERVEIILVTKGKMIVTVGTETFEATAGDTVVFCPEINHRGITKEQSVEYLVLMFDAASYINSTAAVIVMLEGFIRGHKTLKPHITDARVEDIIKDIFECAKKRTDEAAVYIEGNIYILLSYLFENYAKTEQVSLPQKRFSRVFDYISENLDRDLSTAMLCKTFGYDKSYFCRRFKADSGLSPSGYVRIMRLEKSKGLLLKGMSVSDAANLCGFSSYGYFERCFKAEYKITPRQYVKMANK